MALPNSNTAVGRMRECSGRDAVYAIRFGACMRIVRRSRTQQGRVFARPYTARMQSIREGKVLMSSSMLMPRMRLLVSLLASTYYFPWPSHAFIHRIVGLACKEPSKASLARIGREVYEQFKAFRVLDGQLAAAPSTKSTYKKGISCTKNPSERRCGRIRFEEIIKDLPAVLTMLSRMEVYFAKNAIVSVAAMLKVLRKSCIYKSKPTY